jgi:hypothetical protein
VILVLGLPPASAEPFNAGLATGAAACCSAAPLEFNGLNGAKYKRRILA